MHFFRQRQGQSLLELAASLMVVVPVILVLIDCAFLALGAGTNDAVCRDAARAAAGGPPGLLAAGSRTVGTGAPPNKRAVGIIKRVYQSNLPLKLRESAEVQEKIESPVPAAPHGGPVIGEVAVETTLDVYPPFLVRALVGSQSFAFKSRHSYPYTYVMPNAEGGP